MSSSGRRRFNQISLVVISGLLLTGSGLLIALGPPPDSHRTRPSVPDSEEESTSQESQESPEATFQDAEQPDDPDAAADALAPANVEKETWEELERRQAALRASSSETIRLGTGGRGSLFDRKSRGSHASGLVTIRNVPLSDSDVESAWKQAARNACEFVAPNEPFEITRLTPFLTDTDRRQATSRQLTPSIRQHVLSVGLHMSRQAEQSLPVVSKSQITDYIHSHYVTIQARVQRDPVSGMVYLHHRPMAATMQFSGPRMTQEFTDTVARSVNDFRSIGLWLRPDEEPTPENLRTLVLADRYETSKSEVRYAKPQSACELMFVRARVKDGGVAADERIRSRSSREMADDRINDLELHTFVTTEGRKLLHHIGPDSDLRSSQQCGIRVLVMITSYSNGVYPTGSVVVGQEIRSSKTYSRESLNQFARQKGWTGNCFDHLSELLDAIINRELTAG